MPKGKLHKQKHGKSVGRCPVCMAVLKYCHGHQVNGHSVFICPICKTESDVSKLKGGYNNESL